uniref:NFAM1 Ig-like domain-containing protein n=1 Tax=Ursus americanus TaxID=9643 RepID=A0A452RXN3_URSAM
PGLMPQKTRLFPGTPPPPHIPGRVPGFLGKLLLFPFPFSAGGQSVTHTGAPILVTLANKAVSFNCSITYPDSPGLQNFTTWYFHVDLQGQESPREQIKCSPDLSRENQGHTLQCRVTPDLPSASATGMYYCCVRWPDSHRISEGVFILVRGEASCREGLV